MPPKPLIPLALAAALAAAAAPAAAEAAGGQPYVAYDIGGGEQDHNIALRSFDGSDWGRPVGPVKGKFLRGPSSPRFSPDGTKLLFGGHHKLDRDAQSLWVRAVEGRRLQEVPLDLGQGILRGWDWSPNGRRVVFAATRAGVSQVATIYTARLDGSGLRRVARGQYPTWAQTGGRISFERPGSVHVVRPDGTQHRRLATVAGQYRTDATISPDGRTVLYRRAVRATEAGRTATEEWHTVAVASGDDEVIAVHGGSPGAPRYAAPKYAPDGRRLITAKYQPAVSGGPESSYRVVLVDPATMAEEPGFLMDEEEPYDGFPDLDLQPVR